MKDNYRSIIKQFFYNTAIFHDVFDCLVLDK